METLSEREHVAGHFDVYVEGLREYFAHRNMAYGAAENLPAMVDALSVPGTFREDVASLLRSMLFRENGGVTPADLVKIFVEAVAGHDLDETAGEYREQVGQTLRFVSGVLRMRRGGRLEEAEAVPEAAAAAEESAAPKRDLEAMRAPGVMPWSAYMDSEATEAEGVVEAPVVASEVPLLGNKWKERGQVYALAFGLCLLAIAVGAGVWYQNDGFRKTKDLSTNPVVTAYTPPADAVAKPTPYGDSVRRSATLPGRGTSSAYSASSRTNRSAAPVAVAPAGASVEAVPDAAVPTQAPAPIYRSSPATPYQGNGVGPASGSSNAPAALAHPAAPLRTSRVYGYRGNGIYVLSSGTMAGNLVSAPVPEYPKFANMMGSEGQVVIQAVVARNGAVIATHILRGPRLLRGAANNAVKQWHYRPYVLNGRATDVATIVTIDFRLHH